MSHSDRPDPESLILENGELAATANEVFTALDLLEVEHHSIEHGPVYTVSEAKAIVYDIPGAHTKNLFLRNKKGRMFLLVVEEDRQVDLRGLRDLLQAPGGQIAFASTERMSKFLGVVPGSVTPLAVINDHQNKVQVILQGALLEHQWIYLHPCRNSFSTRIKTTDLVRVLGEWEHPPTIIDFD